MDPGYPCSRFSMQNRAKEPRSESIMDFADKMSGSRDCAKMRRSTVASSWDCGSEGTVPAIVKFRQVNLERCSPMVALVCLSIMAAFSSMSSPVKKKWNSACQPPFAVIPTIRKCQLLYLLKFGK